MNNAHKTPDEIALMNRHCGNLDTIRNELGENAVRELTNRMMQAVYDHKAPTLADYARVSDAITADLLTNLK